MRKIYLKRQPKNHKAGKAEEESALNVKRTLIEGVVILVLGLTLILIGVNLWRSHELVCTIASGVGVSCVILGALESILAIVYACFLRYKKR